jgi:hypothetical protein
MNSESENQSRNTGKTYPESYALISVSKPDSSSKAENDRSDYREPSDRNAEHFVPLHEATAFGFSGALMGIALGVVFTLFMVTRHNKVIPKCPPTLCTQAPTPRGGPA